MKKILLISILAMSGIIQATPLTEAIKSNDIPKALSLIKAKKYISACGPRDPMTGKTPLMLAVSRNQIPLVCALLKAGVNINDEDIHGNHALSIASSRSKNTELMSILTQTPNIDPDKLGKVLIDAIKYNDIEIAQMIIRINQDIVNYIEPLDGNTPLIVCTRHIYPETSILQLLLASGADTSIQNKRGNTAFDVAMTSGYIKAINILTTLGVNVPSRPPFRRPLMRSHHNNVIKNKNTLKQWFLKTNPTKQPTPQNLSLFLEQQVKNKVASTLKQYVDIPSSGVILQIISEYVFDENDISEAIKNVPALKKENQSLRKQEVLSALDMHLHRQEYDQDEDELQFMNDCYAWALDNEHYKTARKLKKVATLQPSHSSPNLAEQFKRTMKGRISPPSFSGRRSPFSGRRSPLFGRQSPSSPQTESSND